MSKYEVCVRMSVLQSFEQSYSVKIILHIILFQVAN